MWGASFLFLRIASPVLGPFVTIELRVLLAGLALLLYAAAARRNIRYKDLWKKYIIIGALNAAIPFVLISTATLTLNASLAAILNSTTPLFAALVAMGWLGERLTLKKVLGFLMGVTGVVILLGWNPIPLTPKVLLSASFSILAAITYAFGGVYTKKALAGVDSLSLAIGQQMAAALLILPIALTKLPKVPVSGAVAISIAGLALPCTAIAYLIYFYLIGSVGPTKTLCVTFLVPLFGVIWGFVFLREVITISMLLGLSIILLSIFTISDIDIGALFKKEAKKL